MKNSKLRRILLLAACAVLLVCLSVGATLAYLTSTTEVAVNTFTVGQVNITLDELLVDEYGNQKPLFGEDGEHLTDENGDYLWETERGLQNQYILVPGHKYMKDPTVHVLEGSQECYLFVKVVNGIEAIEADANGYDEEGNLNYASLIATQMEVRNWAPLEGEENVWYYLEGPVDARQQAVDLEVFWEFTLADDADVAAYENASITIQAYAVQADGFDSAQAAWEAAPCEWE